MPRSSSITKNEAEIGLRAYRIWEAEGKPHGKDFDHWLKAEAEVSAEATTAAPTRKKAAAKKTTAKKPAAAKPKK